MQELSKKILIYLKDHPKASPEELKELGEEAISLVMASTHTDNHKKNLIMKIRKDIKDLLGAHELLDFLKLPKELVEGIKEAYQEKVWSNLEKKEIISLPEYVKLCETLLEHEKLEFLFLGLRLATGRRFSEISAKNFEIDPENPENLIFSGQLKKKEEEPESFSIPLLVKRNLVLKGFIRLSESSDYVSTDKFRQSLIRHSHWLFKHDPHKLRAKYTSLIMTREGVLESDSTIDPLVRAKELLGHTEESNATLAYRQFAVEKGFLDPAKLSKTLKKLAIYKRKGEKDVRIGFLKIEDELEKLGLGEKAELPWSSFLPLAKAEYESAYDRKPNYYTVKKFFEKKRQELLDAIE